MKISQETVVKLLPTNDEFWRSFHRSLQAPFSLFNNHKDITFDKWVEMTWNTNDLKAHLEILFEYPIIKGEFCIAFSKGFILTNYRLVINDVGEGKPSIPLSNLIKYNDGIIKFEKNGQVISLNYGNFLKESFVNLAKTKFLEKKLTETQFSLLSQNLFDIKNDNVDLIIPKLEMYPLTEEQITENNQKKVSTTQIKMNKLKQKHHLFAAGLGFITYLIIGTLLYSEDYKLKMLSGYSPDQASEYTDFPDLFFDGFTLIIPVYFVVIFVLWLRAKKII